MCVAPRRGRVGVPRRWVCVAVCAFATSLLLGCTGDDGSAPDRTAVERALAEREGLSSSDAACVAGYVTEGYDAEALQTLVDEGVEALPSSQWGEYVISMVTCTMGDELTGAVPGGGG